MADITEPEQRKARIRALNDALRRGECTNGKVLLTSGIHERGEPFVAAVVRGVMHFDDFGEDNDPHREHDFGALEVEGERVFFKVDYYDETLQWLSPDPADPSVTKRVLTIMLAHEY